MDGDNERITIHNVNLPGQTTQLSRVMREAMKATMWRVLPT
jgi:hypothetical protein